MTEDELYRLGAAFTFLVAIICAGIGVGLLTRSGWGWVFVAACLAGWICLDTWRWRGRK